VTKLTLGCVSPGTFQAMRRIGIVATVVVGTMAWSSTGLAAPTEVPKVTNLRAQPAPFCAKKTSRCAHPGTNVRFSISTAAKVRCDFRPRSENTFGYVEFVKQLPQGANSVRVNDKRLTPGRWTIRVQATNSVGSGPIATVDVRVVKRK
jgi:hypothetical protein